MIVNDGRRSQREVLGVLAAAAASPPPAVRRAEVMRAASSRRAAGVVVGQPAPLTPLEAFEQALASFDETLDELAAADWRRTVTPYDWTVHQLVAHVGAIDHYLAATLGLVAPAHDPALADDHIAMTLAAVERSGAERPSATRAARRRIVRRLLGHLEMIGADSLRDRFRFHYLDARLPTVLLVRVFEIWTHTEDIRRAVGRPLVSPGAAMLQPMTRLAVQSIPLGLAMRGDECAGRVARIVLIGEGAGLFTQPLGLGERAVADVDPEVTIVADATAFCRLAAQRLTVDEVDADFEGDADLGRRVLAAAAMFAA